MKGKLLVMIALVLVGCLAYDYEQFFSPPNVARESTIWKWCDCGSGTKEVVVWPAL